MESYKRLFDINPLAYKHPRGDIWMPGVFTPEAVNEVSKFRFRDTDIFSPTYPKTGKILILRSCGLNFSFLNVT